MILDELIELLQTLKEEFGGDIQVFGNINRGGIQHFSKNDNQLPKRFVCGKPKEWLEFVGHNKMQ